MNGLIVSQGNILAITLSFSVICQLCPGPGRVLIEAAAFSGTSIDPILKFCSVEIVTERRGFVKSGKMYFRQSSCLRSRIY